MPHIRSLQGLCMTARYVKNWYMLLALYAGLISKTAVRFRDGQEIDILRHDYTLFYEEIFRRYLQNKGFVYRMMEEKIIIQTPNGLQITLKPFLYKAKTYSFVLDEIFVMKVYGEPNLHGQVVLDLGASLGDSSLYFAKLGASEVYGYEPDVKYYHLAQENIKLNGMEEKIHIYNESATSDKVKHLISQHRLQNIFLKIDCDGCEFEFTEKLDDMTCYNITDIVMEYHGEPRRLIQKLSRLGYRVYCKKHIFWKTDGIIVAKRLMR